MTEAPKSFFQKIVGNGELKLNRKLGIYLVCLLLACVLWLLITLSEKYETDIIFPVTYSGIPGSKVVANHLPETITARVSGGGFSLLWYKLKGRGETLTLEIAPSKLRENNGIHYSLTNNRIEKVSAQLGDKIRVLHISPDTIYVDYSEKTKRKIRVKPDLKMTIQKQHGLSDSVKTEPEFVTVTGPKHLVEKMQFALTEQVTLNDVSDKKTMNIGFAKPGNPEVLIFSPETVKLTIPVEKYTEGSKEIPVTIRNHPKGSRLKVYPEKVKVTYLVGLSKYDKVDAAMFVVGFNYKNLSKGNKVKVEVLTAPAFVNSVKVEPVNVEYIIQK